VEHLIAWGVIFYMIQIAFVFITLGFDLISTYKSFNSKVEVLINLIPFIHFTYPIRQFFKLKFKPFKE